MLTIAQMLDRDWCWTPLVLPGKKRVSFSATSSVEKQTPYIVEEIPEASQPPPHSSLTFEPQPSSLSPHVAEKNSEACSLSLLPPSLS